MRITVNVKTNSTHDEIIKIDDFNYIVKLRSPKRKGKANLALLKLLGNYFGKRIKILRGLTSTTKIIEILE